jgi:hypothetical protein
MAARITVGCLAGSLLALAAAAAPPRSLNEKVLEFCKQNLGRQVGDGECYALAAEALKAAGARPQPTFKDNPGPNDYVWGKLVWVLEATNGTQTEKATAGLSVQPGDVVQFRDTKFSGPLPGGGGYTSLAVRHTAVVAEFRAGSKELVVLHQNWNGNRTVHEQTLLLPDLKDGWLRVYRPVPR